VEHISRVKYLGYSFYKYRGKCRFRVHPKSIAKMKDKIRELTNRSNGWGNEYRALKLTQFIRGWVNYFGMADMKKLLRDTDEWLRHKIRTIYWKQWKKEKRGYAQICVMAAGIVVVISYYRLCLTTRNSGNLDTQHSQSFI